MTDLSRNETLARIEAGKVERGILSLHIGTAEGEEYEGEE